MTISKVWEDNGNAYKTRTDSVNVVLQCRNADDENAQWQPYTVKNKPFVVTLSNANNWEAKFYALSGEYDYRIRELKNGSSDANDTIDEGSSLQAEQITK